MTETEKKPCMCGKPSLADHVLCQECFTTTLRGYLTSVEDSRIAEEHRIARENREAEERQRRIGTPEYAEERKRIAMQRRMTDPWFILFQEFGEKYAEISEYGPREKTLFELTDELVRYFEDWADGR